VLFGVLAKTFSKFKRAIVGKFVKGKFVKDNFRAGQVAQAVRAPA
jgi:hypothetical protein